MSQTKDSVGMRAVGLATGMTFGALLKHGKLGAPDTILDQIQFKDWRVVQTMGSAVVVGGLGVHMAVKSGYSKFEVKPLKVGGVVGGAILFGMGMAVLGYCPGTSLTAVGEGRRDALAGVAGMLVGAATFVALYPKIKPMLEAGGNYGKVRLSDLLESSSSKNIPRTANPDTFSQIM